MQVEIIDLTLNHEKGSIPTFTKGQFNFPDADDILTIGNLKLHKTAFGSPIVTSSDALNPTVSIIDIPGNDEANAKKLEDYFKTTMTLKIENLIDSANFVKDRILDGSYVYSAEEATLKEAK